MFRTIFSKKHVAPDEVLKDLSANLQKTLGGRLVSLVVFGSYVSGEFHEDRSDLNVLLVVDDVHLAMLTELDSALAAWRSANQPMPVMLQADELPAYAQSLPIEFQDIRDHYRVLAGRDVIEGLSLTSANLKAQCQQELAVKLLKLRQSCARNAGHPERLRTLALESLPSVLTLFRAVLRLKQATTGLSKLEAAERLAPIAGYDTLLLRQIYDLRVRRKTDNLDSMMTGYLDCVERVFHVVASIEPCAMS